MNCIAKLISPNQINNHKKTFENIKYIVLASYVKSFSHEILLIPLMQILLFHLAEV